MLRSFKGRATAYLAASGITAAGIAGAHTYMGTNDQTGADNRDHYACWVQAGSGSVIIPVELWDHLFVYMANAPTTLGFTIHWESCKSQTDVKLDDRLNDGLSMGIRYCLVRNGSKCDVNSVQLNPTQTAVVAAGAGITYYQQARQTWCHEVGHSMGLGHFVAGGIAGAQDCMKQGAANYSTSAQYSAHNQAHLLYDFPW